MYQKTSLLGSNIISKYFSSSIKSSPKSVRAVFKLYRLNQDFKLEDFLKSPGHHFRNARNYNSDGTTKENCLASQITQEQEKSVNWRSPANILWRSRYGQFSGLNYSLLKTVRMTDFLVFNKNYEVDNESIMERCLGCCFFEHKKGLDHCIVDGWEVYGDWGYNKINYHDDFEYSSSTLVQSDFGKLVAARAIITIMNETKLEDLNLANYFWLEKWLSNNELFLQGLDPWRIDVQLCQNPENEVKDSDLVLTLDQVLTQEYLQKYIDKNLEGSFRNGVTNLDDLEAPSYQVKVVDGQVDLSDLKKLFPADDLKMILNYLKRYQKDYLYCDVPAEKMLMELYNTQGPTGLGVFQFNGQTLTEEEAKELLEKQPYFDYLRGVRMKMNFSEYPLLNIERYDRDYGQGSAKRALENARQNKMSRREDLNLVVHI